MKKKICVLCGKEFIPKSNAQTVCDSVHYRKCEICGKEFEIKRPSSSTKCCSKKCTEEKRRRTMLKRHGVEYAQQSKSIHEKSKETNLKRYGYEYAAQSPDIKEKERMIFQKHYGVDTPFLMKDFKYKRESTCMEKYGVKHHLQSSISVNKMKSNYSDTCMEKYGVPYACLTPQCKSAHRGLISNINKAFGHKLDEVGISYQFEFPLEDKSYDIALNNRKILIEIDPTYTHSIVPTHWNTHCKEQSQLEKTKIADKYGYRCIHVFDWDDTSKIISMISDNKTRVYARNCEVAWLNHNDVRGFLNSYHLQGYCRNQSSVFGLIHNGILMQMMSFGVSRYNHNYQWELLRLCTHNDYYVVGGAERLFHHFIKCKNPHSVISYCDLSKFHGDVYERLGFTLHHRSRPSKVWSNGRHKITDNLLRQRGFDQIFGTEYGKGTSNEELMIQNGWLPIYDCGQSVYVWENQ